MTVLYSIHTKQLQRTHLLFQIREITDDSSSSSDHSTSHEVGYEMSEELPSKRFRHLNHVIEMKFKEGMKRKSVNPPGHGEAAEFISDNIDRLLYWENQTL